MERGSVSRSGGARLLTSRFEETLARTLAPPDVAEIAAGRRPALRPNLRPSAQSAVKKQMADVFTKAKRSVVMSKIRGRGNRDTELALAKLFRRHHITGWRRQILLRLQVSGFKFQVRPDFIFRKSHTAVFVDGCFWHGCPQHATQPQNNHSFWRKKLAANRQRDALVTRTLRKTGWRVVRIWEHELRRVNEPRLLACLFRVVGCAPVGPDAFSKRKRSGRG